MSEAQFRVGDVFERMAEIPAGSIDFLCTSPPFLALRSYLPADHPDKGKEIGSEATPAAFLTTLLALTAQWRRVLAPHGSIAVELGDTYSGAGGYGSPDSPNPAYGKSSHNERFVGRTAKRFKRKDDGWPQNKSLCLIPTLYPASLAYGRNLLTGDPCEPWRVRNLIVWHRANPPVGALGDKVRPSTSYVTVACTARNRWFDLDAERTALAVPQAKGIPRAGTKLEDDGGNRATLGTYDASMSAGAPPLDAWFDEPDSDVWTIPTQPFSGAHYATFPVKLPRKLINLMCPRQVCTTCGEPRRRLVEVDGLTGKDILAANGTNDRAIGLAGKRPSMSHITRETLGWSTCGHDTWRRGLVLDPFCGSGTTLVAASELGRDSIGIDLDARNLDLARQRCGMFLTEEPVT